MDRCLLEVTAKTTERILIKFGRYVERSLEEHIGY